MTTHNIIDSHSAVVMHYRISLEEGTEADSTFDEEPLAFRMGDGTLIEGLEAALMGLAEGERKTITLAPDQAFGYPDPGSIQIMAAADFADLGMPEPGQVIGFTTPAGDELPGTVLEAANGFIKVDFNHPFAGHQLTFEVKILKVTNPA